MLAGNWHCLGKGGRQDLRHKEKSWNEDFLCFYISMTLTKCTNVACKQFCIRMIVDDSIIQDERTQNLRCLKCITLTVFRINRTSKKTNTFDA